MAEGIGHRRFRTAPRCEKNGKLITHQVEEIHFVAESLLQPQVDHDSGRLVLDKFGILGAVIGVEPLVGGKNKLHKTVGDVGDYHFGVVGRVDGQIGDYLQSQANQLL